MVGPPWVPTTSRWAEGWGSIRPRPVAQWAAPTSQEWTAPHLARAPKAWLGRTLPGSGTHLGHPARAPTPGLGRTCG
eukprot:scaffold54490_cov31-Phaeocystis_antarctica.AAC.1